jgi:hypothetical protein
LPVPATPPPAAVAMAPVAAYFSGKWLCSGRFSNGKPIASTIRFESDVGGAAVVVHHDDVPALGSYHSIEVWGFQKSTGTYVATLYDAYGGARGFTSAGWSGDVLTWATDAAVTPPQQFVYTKKSADAFTVDWNVYRNEAYVVGDTLTCNRDATS